MVHATPAGGELALRVLTENRDGVVITDTRSRIVLVNRAFSELTGYQAPEVIGRTPAFLHSGVHEPAFYRRLWRTLRRSGVWRGEMCSRRKNGELFVEWITISAIRDGDGILTHYAGIFSDVSDRKRAQLELERLAHHDALTGLPNRLLLHDRLGRALASARSCGARLALLFVDLDGFKEINDRLGHRAGDVVLRAVALRLSRCVRESDTVARLGGDEFVVVLKDLTDGHEAAAVAKNILAKVARPFSVAGGKASLTASIGVALFPQHDTDPGGLLEKADAAMYRAKREARNAFRYYHETSAV